MSKCRHLCDDKPSYWKVRRKSIKEAEKEVNQMIEDEKIARDKAHHGSTVEYHTGSSNSPSQDVQPMEKVIIYIVIINRYGCYLNSG